MSSLDYQKSDSILSSEVVDNDVHVKLQELTRKLNDVEKEKQKVEEEKEKMRLSYDSQRAKYQRLYIQKEDEVKRLKQDLEEAQTQLMLISEGNTAKEKEEKLQEQAQQIAELSQIVQETLEESSSSQNQVKNLQRAIQTLEDQLAKLTLEKGDSILLAPSNMLSATKSFAKKVVSQLGPDLDRTAEDLEDSMRKAKEDTEVIRSLVVPLEKKIDELQEKLRITEEKLQRYEDHGKPNKILGSSASSLDSTGKEGVDTGSPSKSFVCDMCANYEAQLQAQQRITKQLQKQKEILDSNMEKFKEDLAKETQFRKEMEEKWNEKKEEQKLQVIQLKKEVVAGKEEVQELRQTFDSMASAVRDELKLLAFDRQKVNAEMIALLRENEKLVGKHSKHSAKLRNETINFPDTVDELQVLLLKFHEDLIAALVAKEAKEEMEETLKSEVRLLQEQIESHQNSSAVIEERLVTENSSLRQQLKVIDKERNNLKADLEDLRMKEIRYKAEIDNLSENYRRILEETKKQNETITELRTSVSSLQEQLGKSEDVQKDFVRLSQSLQIQLENIRGADTEVRWQHEDDVAECQGCKQPFASAKKKAHCKHCGKMFCPSCLHHTVFSGPNQRPSKVCQVCHTLLNRNTAPYFSQEPPHSPD